MRLSQTPTSLASGRKRRKPPHPPRCGCEYELSQTSKKQKKKLDTICDVTSHRYPIKPTTPRSPTPKASEPKPKGESRAPDAALRRSSRLRGNPPAPAPSPITVNKLKPETTNRNKNKGFADEKAVGGSNNEKGKISETKFPRKDSKSPSSGDLEVNWDSRLRPRVKNVGVGPQKQQDKKSSTTTPAKRKLLRELNELKECKGKEEEVENDDGFENGVSWARKSKRVSRVRLSKGKDQLTGSSGCARSEDRTLQAGLPQSNEEEAISPLKNLIRDRDEMKDGSPTPRVCDGDIGSDRSLGAPASGTRDESEVVICRGNLLRNKEVNQTVQCDTSNFEKEICPELCPSNVEEHVDDSNDREADLGLRVKFTDGKDFDTSELCCKWSGDKCTEAAGLISESQVGFDICRRGDVIECVPDETKDEDALCNLFSETMNRSYKEKFGLVPKSSIAMDRTPPTAVSAEQLENGGSHEDMDADPDLDLVKSFPLGPENKSSTDVLKHDPISSDKLGKLGIKEGRRCGLCGGGVDGKPPKKLVRVSAESDTEAYDGLPASDETNYNIWDGFGDEPGWLGRLLGPINDRYGIAGVWVHQHCAVWSPEVYFAGLGCLKNVRAALCRGRALKCSRCGRPGATIGCRVDRCPKTYHLPCGRADGCIFDHRKFLIACTDHSHLFQPQGKQYMHRIKKMKARKMKLDMRKVATDAWRKDLEAEEKWLENCGEDEEFLRREGKRLHRDVSRIAPVYIGGSSPTSEKLYEGWESVAGLQDVIQCMKEVVILPLLYPDFFNNLGLTPPRGVLLHGYPGTGKTLVVRALVGACSRGDKRIAYFARKGADCLGKYVGDAERQLRLLFQVAEKSQPSIIFFDEIDGLAPRRTRQQDQTHSSVVSTLLALLDGLKSRGSVIVIGATNRPDAVDPALRRPGRFDREIFFPLPSVKDRSAILSLHTRKWPKPVSGSLLMQIAKRTGGFAGADLQALCTQAAMIALKRNCALHELLSAAERRSHQGKRLSLPSFVVDERDWFAALACAPPPCSRREAGMAVNSVVSSPLHSHLVSCLMQPLAELLISLYLDEHIVLPSALYNAAQLIEGTVTSALKRKNISTVSWWSHLSYLIREPDVLKEIERSFSPVGLLIDTFCYSTSDQLGVDNDDGNENLEYHKLNPAGVHMHANSMDNFTYSASKASGFRVLIGGYPRSGQRHLASCVLHGFEGHIEIKKVDLATISREGHGDLVQGITHILLKCQGIGPCIIYMPRIDLWALDETSHQASGKEMDFDPETRELVQPVHAGVARNNASHAWNSLVEQMDSMPNSSFLMVLATFETTNHVLPLSIMEFFTCDVLSSTKLVPSKHTIPRFYVQLDGNFNRDMVIDASAVKLSRDLSQRYVQMIHSGTHNDDARMDFKINDTVEVHSQAKSHETENQSNHVTENQSSSKVDQVHRYVNDERYSSMSNATGNHKDEILPCSHQDSSLKNLSERIMVKGKSTLQLAIATFGYQILRYPHFAELCWATSKLKEGPSADINGPWKGWPFNSCVVYANGSSENVPVGESLSQHKNTEQYSVVRGLVAVGLLAYRGVYKSAREVSFEVRKVLELLVGQINARIRDGKDGYRFLRLLSQVAYLEDMVSSWVCTVQSLDVDNQQLLSKSKSRHIEESLHTDDHIDVSTPVKDDAYMANMSYNNCQELKSDSHDKSPEKFTARNNECVDLEPGAFRHGLPNSSQWCVYDCCSECFHALHIFTKKFLKDSWESGGCCSTIDDVHDIVASCSTNLLSEISRLGTAESFRNGGISAMECNCHLKSKNMGIKNACVISQSDPGLMLSQDFAHVPSDSNGDVQFHCKSEHLCLSSLIEKILKIKRPCD